MNRLPGPLLLDAVYEELVRLEIDGALATGAHAYTVRWFGRHADLRWIRAQLLPAERNARRRQAIARLLVRAELAAAPATSERQRIEDDITDLSAEIAEQRAGGRAGWFWDYDSNGEPAIPATLNAA